DVGGSCVVERSEVYGNDGVDCRTALIVCIDARDQQPHELLRREGAGSHRCLDVMHARSLQIERSHFPDCLFCTRSSPESAVFILYAKSPNPSAAYRRV